MKVIRLKRWSLALLAYFSPFFHTNLAAAENKVQCKGSNDKIEVTITDKASVTFLLNGNKVEQFKETWIFSNNKRGDAIVPEELTLVTEKYEFRLENLGTCPDGKSIRVRHFSGKASDKIFLEEAACVCSAK